MIAWAALPWTKIAAAAAFLGLVGAGIAWHVHRVDLARSQGFAAGKADVQTRCDADIIAREQAEARRAAGNRERADAQSMAHEAARAAALEHDRQEARDAAKKALRRSISCPAGQSVAVGDVVVPGAALAGLRRAAGAGDRPRAD